MSLLKTENNETGSMERSYKFSPYRLHWPWPTHTQLIATNNFVPKLSYLSMELHGVTSNILIFTVMRTSNPIYFYKQISSEYKES
jgi:hypothetical protein